MCGVAGLVSRSPREEAWLHRKATAMAEALSHRGPDDHGASVFDARVALAHRRLSILDLTAEGHQPMVREGEGLAITFNGEIYNYVELAEELASLGVRFRGHSDTEVLLAGLRRWGVEATLGRLLGMFAFAVWDPSAGRLILARDRVGKKPLYYVRQGDTLLFASEIKALHVGSDRPLRPSRESLLRYLHLGFIPAPATAFEGVEEVPAGHWLEATPDGQVRLHRYWSLPTRTGERGPAGATGVEATVEELLSEAVRVRLRADVPVGVFLSGGIDSGLITALAARHSATPVRTFTVAFDVQAFDESPQAARVAAAFGTRHEILRIETRARDLVPRVAAALDEPHADPSVIPTFAISEAAARHVKVVLNGEGADEQFGGYRRHLAMRWLEGAPPVARVPARAVAALLSRLPAPRSFRTPYAFAHRFVRGLAASPARRYLAWTSDVFDPMDPVPAGGPELLARLAEELERAGGGGDLSAFMRLDFELGMRDSLLVKLDMCTMAHSLEARNPFLDHRLVEYAFSLPTDALFPRRGTKPLLRGIARRMLPAGLSAEPKRGFEIPLGPWLRGELRDLVHDVCEDPTGVVAELVPARPMKKLLGPGPGIPDEQRSKRLWSLLMLGLWDRSRPRSG